MTVPPCPVPRVPFPPDLVAEIDAELELVDDRLAHGVERRAALELLRVRAVGLAAALGRPVTVFDLFSSVRTEQDRDRLVRLMHSLRGVPHTRLREVDS